MYKSKRAVGMLMLAMVFMMMFSSVTMAAETGLNISLDEFFNADRLALKLTKTFHIFVIILIIGYAIIAYYFTDTNRNPDDRHKYIMSFNLITHLIYMCYLFLL